MDEDEEFGLRLGENDMKIARTLLCPLISPVEVPVSIINACPNFSLPSPTAIIRLLSPSHSRSFLIHVII